MLPNCERGKQGQILRHIPHAAISRVQLSYVRAMQENATGHNASMGRALEYVGFAGRLAYVGITTQEISFAHPLMHRREMTLLASSK